VHAELITANGIEMKSRGDISLVGIIIAMEIPPHS
jgi:hypothetical protein